MQFFIIFLHILEYSKQPSSSIENKMFVFAKINCSFEFISLYESCVLENGISAVYKKYSTVYLIAKCGIIQLFYDVIRS